MKRSSDPREALKSSVDATDNGASLPDGLFLLCSSGFVILTLSSYSRRQQEEEEEEETNTLECI